MLKSYGDEEKENPAQIEQAHIWLSVRAIPLLDTRMRRLGALLMIIGVNLAVGACAAAFWNAAYRCVQESCDEGGMGLFIDIMLSAQGLVYWAVIVVGAGLFWRGRRIRMAGRE